MRLTTRALASAVAMVTLAACSAGAPASEPDDGITCDDGYVAHPSESRDRNGCGPHGGIDDPFMDKVNAYLDALPNSPASHYVCRDGWTSLAVGQPGACSWHGGIGWLAWPDGTRASYDGPPMVIRPDGSVVRP